MFKQVKHDSGRTVRPLYLKYFRAAGLFGSDASHVCTSIDFDAIGRARRTGGFERYPVTTLETVAGMPVNR
jgi:hypothetical protein